MTTCPGYDCASRDRCWRFAVPFAIGQTVLTHDPRGAGGACPLFLPASAFRRLEGEVSDAQN